MHYHIKILHKLVLMPFLSSAAPFGLTVKKQGDILKIWDLTHDFTKKREE